MCRQCQAERQTGPLGPVGISDNDKMMWLLADVISFIVPLVILLSDSGERRPFQQLHAVHSLALSSVLLVLTSVLTRTIGPVLELPMAGLRTCCLLPLALILYALANHHGVQTYQGQYAVMPVITDFVREKGWLG